MDQAFLHYFWYADFKNVKISNFDGIFPFPLAVESFSTVGPRFYPRSHQQENEDKIGGTLKVGFFKQAFGGI